MLFRNFEEAVRFCRAGLKNHSYVVRAHTWQGVDVSEKPDMAMREIMDTYFRVPLQSHCYWNYQDAIKPNLPWADDHFDERVCGMPLNPGEQWKHWPWGQNANRFLDEKGQFNHNYMERYWPKFAGPYTDDGEIRVVNAVTRGWEPNAGIRHNYGDLSDVVDLLERDPLTRQAYLPIFFPEDTGAVHGDRLPCSLGHQFLLRNGQFHHTYYIRSCDFIRHFRDDIYLSLRLHLWMLDQLRGSPVWRDIKPGFFTMHITSLHMFVNDWQREFSNEE